MKKSLIFMGVFLLLSVYITATEPEGKSETMPEYGNWENFTTKDGLPANKIFCVRADGDRVWIGTSHGLVLYENEEFKTFTMEDGLTHPGVLSIDVSELTGDVWIGTLGGLVLQIAESYQDFNEEDGLTNLQIHSLAEDSHGIIWIGTFRFGS